MIQRGTELQLTIEGPVFSTTGGSSLGGEGMSVARQDGFVFFVIGAVPGDVVKARVVKVKKNYAEAKVISIERPSSLRTQPRCKHFGVCGGCKWQHVDYQAQLRFKQQRVVDAFERIGGFSQFDISPIIGAEEIYDYRNKMEFSFSDQQWLESLPLANSGFDVSSPSGWGKENSRLITRAQSDVFLGLHVPQRYDKVLEIDECHLQSSISNRILNFTRDFARKNQIPVFSSRDDSGYLRFLVIRQSRRTNELMVNLVTYEDRSDVMMQFSKALRGEIPGITTIVNTVNSRKAQIAYGEVEKVYFGDGVIHEQLGKFVFTVSASSFFQTNTTQAEKLYETTCSMADLKKTDVVYDLYSGTGSIAIFVSQNVREVLGFESSESAVRDAKRNAAANNRGNCDFILGDMKEQLSGDTDWKRSHPT
ncbi:MAG TPA: methyltransferase domain-containing protein, partial [Bacteroidota bacterium]|nr:methyltransferase domain-containing protein [Bacteroidota bacterium]